MPITKSELAKKLSIIAAYDIPDLIQAINPDELLYNLRWLYDIQYQQAITRKILEKLAPEQINTELYQKLATVLMQIGEYDRAIEYYQKAQEKMQADTSVSEENKLIVQINCEIGLGVSSREKNRKKNVKETTDHLEKALELANTLKNYNNTTAQSHLANIEREYGIVYLITGDFETAQTHFTNARKHCEEAKETLQLFLLPIKNYIALCLFRQNKINEAIEQFEQVHTEYQELPNFKTQIGKPECACQDYGSHLFHYGMASLQTADSERTIQLLEQALLFRNDLTGQQQNRIADVLIPLGKAYLQKGDSKQAHVYFLRAKEIYENLPDPIAPSEELKLLIEHTKPTETPGLALTL